MRDFRDWINENYEHIKAAAEATTSSGRLLDIELYPASRILYTRFNYTTGDAAGQNLTGKATQAACHWIVENNPTIEQFFLESNFATDKKSSQVNMLRTRGKRVVAEAVIPNELIQGAMRTSTELMFRARQVSQLGGFMSGVTNNGSHSANGVTAMFIATGQDAANVAESSAAFVYAELRDNGDYYYSITIPSLIVATYGGGTGLPTQRECLDLLGCYGKGKVREARGDRGGHRAVRRDLAGRRRGGRGVGGGPRPARAQPSLVSLPFQPRSLRAFSIYAEHNVGAARTLVKRFWPRPAGVAIAGFERVSGRTFPALKPGKGFYSVPSFYMGNHTTFVGDGEPLAWPSHTDWLDLELELGFVLDRDVADASPDEGAAAIGGFFVVNDWSARDVQAREYREGMFGPAVKSKSFATGIGAEVVDAAEVLPRWDSLRASLRGERRGLERHLHRGRGALARRPGGLRLTGRAPGRRRRVRDGHAAARVRAGAGPLAAPRGRGAPGDRGSGDADQPRRRARVKPLSLLALAGTAAHHGFERWAGVGLVLEPWLGRRRAEVFWSAIFAWWLTEAVTGREGASGFRAWGAGMSVAGAVVHFADWPWSLRWGFLPWLDEAEGLTPERVPAYNTILWVWLVGGAASGLFETGAATAAGSRSGWPAHPAMRASARHHFAWAREQARRDPESWSPELLCQS